MIQQLLDIVDLSDPTASAPALGEVVLFHRDSEWVPSSVLEVVKSADFGRKMAVAFNMTYTPSQDKETMASLRGSYRCVRILGDNEKLRPLTDEEILEMNNKSKGCRWISVRFSDTGLEGFTSRYRPMKTCQP